MSSLGEKLQLLFLCIRGTLVTLSIRDKSVVLQTDRKPGPEVIKKKFMLNSTEHEILIALQYKKKLKQMKFSGLNHQS